MQIHKRLSREQVKTIFKGYCERNLEIEEALTLLGLKRSRFFILLARYRKDPESFSFSYYRHTPKQLSSGSEEKIKRYLFEDRELVFNPEIPICNYNYSAVKDRLKKQGVTVSLPTIIDRAKQYGCYQPKKKLAAVHDREVITTAIGALIQHDSSIHLWSPYALQKWYLITSLDDYSRKLLYANLQGEETTWCHIEAVKELILSYGLPLEYYVDSLRIFRYVAHGESVWVNQRVGTDGVNPQWKDCLKRAGTEVIHALSAQAKGKIERPYGWLQDRIVRTCALEHITDINQARGVLKEEVNRYNWCQVHSTTKEIPALRFERAKKEGKTLFRPFTIPTPYTNINDIFCLVEKRITNSYRKISLWNLEVQLPKVAHGEEVEIHLIPNPQKQTIAIRIWHNTQLVYQATYPKSYFPKVQF